MIFHKVRAFFTPDPAYQAEMLKVGSILTLLAFLQCVAWIIPPQFGPGGVPGYLPLHTFFETVSIVVAMMVFMVGWNSRGGDLQGNVAVLACVFFAIAMLDFSHTMSYQGMPDYFSTNNAGKNLYFWLAARWLAALVLLVVAIREWTPIRSINVWYMWVSSLILLTLLIHWLVLFKQDWLPHTFIPGEGLTPFKKNLEYLFIGINLISALILLAKMRTKKTFSITNLFAAVCVMAMSEFYFTLYTTFAGEYIVLGHTYKVISYYFIYRAIVVESIELPYHKLKQSQSKLGMALSASKTGLWEWDLIRNSWYYSPEWKEQLGYTNEEFSNTFETWISLLHPNDKRETVVVMKDFVSSVQTEYESEFRLQHRNGSYRWILARGKKIFDASDNLVCLMGSYIDITEKMQSAELIWQQANFDALTQLSNRHMFLNRLEQEILKSNRYQTKLALLLIDLDHFKEVNDTLGHDVGDKLLKEVAHRICECVRKSDVVARLGGDEFTVIIPELPDTHHLHQIGQKLLSELALPYYLSGETVHTSACIGISIYPNDGVTLDELMKHADQAMYVAKNMGRNRLSYYTQSMQDEVQNRLLMTKELHMALDNQQFEIYYQPIVEIATGNIRKAEALIRWHHPERGMVRPDEFIPLAESTELIIPIGEWVFKEAVKQVKLWRSKFHESFQMSVNKSPVQIRHEGSAEYSWPDYLKQQEVDGDSITIEITEGLLLNAETKINNKLLQFRDAGIQVSIDDFGTGYSSLAYLKKFDIDFLKIDKSFICNLDTDVSNQALCKAIIVMAHELGFQVIAEGVETQEQLEFLKTVRCDFAQGYLFSKPVPPDEFEKLLLH